MKWRKYITEATYKEEIEISELVEMLDKYIDRKEKEYSDSYNRLQYKDYMDEHDRFSRDFYSNTIKYFRDIKKPLGHLNKIYKEFVKQTKTGKRLTD